MYQVREYRTSLILAAAVAGAGLVAGCATTQPVAESAVPAHRDAREDASYQRYLMDEHRAHREFASLSPQEQRDYWDWRSRNPGS